MQYALYILTVMDHFGNGLPVAFIFSEKEDAETLTKVLEAFRGRMQELKPGWRPSCFLVDDDPAEALAVRCAAVLLSRKPALPCNMPQDRKA